MRILLGNPEPTGAPGPTITYVTVRDHKEDDGSYSVGYVMGSDAAEIKDHLFDNPGLVTHLPGQQAILCVTRSWADHATTKPSWVFIDPEDRDPESAEDFERFLSDFWKCPRGIPGDLEETHFTFAGPPGVGPSEGE